ncbi:MAG: hypothetical protein RI953_2328 [Pseudomonadota bacterium]
MRVTEVSSKSLKLARKDESFRILDVVSGHPLSERLLELGLQTGEFVKIVHEAPLSGDPIVLEVCGTKLALRREEAALIFVEDLSSENGAKP